MNHSHNLELLSCVSCLPKNFELNSKEGFDLFGKDIHKVITLTGIDKRHIAPEGLSVLDLAVESAKRLFDIYEVDKNKIGVIIYISYTFENRLPGDVNKLVYLLDLPRNIPTFDLSGACSGFLQGLFLASVSISNLPDDMIALIINGDVQSKFISKRDRGTYPVFGDCATSSIFKKSSKKYAIKFLSKGENEDDLKIKGFSSKYSPNHSDFDFYSFDKINYLNNFNIHMNGISVYNFVINDVKNLIFDFLKNNSFDNFDYFIPHQANEFISKNLAKNLNIYDKLLISSNEFGNVGSSSIPLTITRHIPNKNNSVTILLSGFGAGLSANCTLMNISKNFKSDIIYMGEMHER
jgi:3-oxoacyl-[acyl-carrier-protein] synthase-3